MAANHKILPLSMRYSDSFRMQYRITSDQTLMIPSQLVRSAVGAASANSRWRRMWQAQFGTKEGATGGRARTVE